MGTTIRREPVNFDIPDAPNYKFLNITNFRGLDVSSNPFELATNTASDCLNVYVDETNTLTTRPRLEKKIATTIDGEHIGTYNLHNGYLLHYLVDGAGVMKTLIDGVLTDVTGKDLTPDVEDVANKQYYEIPSVKCEYFEQGDKIYLLDGERYMVIFENELNDVEGYIPTTAVVSLSGEKKDVEPLNVLSDKYTERTFWDGTVKDLQRSIFTKTDTIDVVNDYYQVVELDLYDNGYEIQSWFSDGSALLRKYNIDISRWEFFYATFNSYFSGMLLTLAPFSVSDLNYISVASNTKDVVCYNARFLLDETYVTDHYYLRYFKWNGAGWDNAYSKYISNGINNYSLKISGNGTYVYYRLYQVFTQTQLWNVIEDTVEQTANRTTFDEVITVISPNETYGLELCKSDYYGFIRYTVFYFTLKPYTQSLGAGTFVTNHENFKFSDDGNYFYTYNDIYSLDVPSASEYAVYVFNNFPNTRGLTRIPFDETFRVNRFAIYDDSYIIPKKVNNSYVMYYGDLSNPLNVQNSYIKSSSTFTRYFHKKYIVYGSGSKLQIGVWIDNDEPLMFVTSHITLRHNDYKEWLDKQNDVLQARLFTRFDNNYWFANKNRYYRSQNNDPTYFPITEYNALGDSNEEITGFNLANDTTLIAYKKQRIYLIQPFTSSLDTTEYTITESKNTVGNTAIGAPIVTTLTEIPLQINNDGIYGLSQLSNVSATERIADLMSEPINERWLNINDALITNAQTLNRLYWTYVILPDQQHEKTMIYLLDNRSNSWYYWELPIVVVNAFTKDNRAEFVDVDGNIYYLTSTDVLNKAFDTQLVTEYYDDGRKLIPWYWQSQIMPLGTMNYSKRLVNTTFILTDTDDKDGYGLNYSFKVFRKLASSTPEKELTGDLTLVRSTTKKTNISKFGFVQLKLSNITEESQGTEPEKAFRNNKLRLVGLGLKYVLLEGLIR